MNGNDAWRAQTKQELDMGPGEPNVTELRELEKAEIRDIELFTLVNSTGETGMVRPKVLKD